MPAPRHFLDARSKIHPKKTLDGTFFTPEPYPQVFGNIFVPNLSILDVLCCIGPQANEHLKTAIQTEIEL
jgi:hypothetical protein